MGAYEDYQAAIGAYGSAAPTDNMEVRRQSPQLEGIQAALAPQLAQSLANPINPMGGTNQYGQAYGSFMPQAQGQNALQQSAIQAALNQAGLGTAQFGPGGGFAGLTPGTGTGIAGYQPFLNQAATDLNAASAAAAAGQGVGAGALQQSGIAMNAAQAAAAAGQDAGAGFMGPGAQAQFESPYRQDVVDPTLAQFDRRTATQAAQAGLADASAGTYGGDRAAVREGARQAQSELDRALLEAGLLQQGYTQAQNQANTAFNQANTQAMQNMNMYGTVAQGQQGLAQGLQGQAGQNVGLFSQTGQGQSGLASLQPTLAAQNLGMIGTLGSQQQQQGQALLDTSAQGNQMMAYNPQQGMGFVGGQLAGLQGGYGTTSSNNPAQGTTSPIAALTAGVGAGMNLGNLFGFGS